MFFHFQHSPVVLPPVVDIAWCPVTTSRSHRPRSGWQKIPSRWCNDWFGVLPFYQPPPFQCVSLGSSATVDHTNQGYIELETPCAGSFTGAINELNGSKWWIFQRSPCLPLWNHQSVLDFRKMGTHGDPMKNDPTWSRFQCANGCIVILQGLIKGRLNTIKSNKSTLW